MFARDFWKAAVFLLVAEAMAFGECVPVSEAGKHLGETRCVSGKVFRVERGAEGITYLDFCEDYRSCPFGAVIFAHDLKSIGDVRQLRGKTVEIHGELKPYDGRAQIVVEEPRQIGGEGARLPPLPRNYDVENRGHYSAGSFSLPRPGYATTKKRQTAKLPIQIPEDDPED